MDSSSIRSAKRKRNEIDSDSAAIDQSNKRVVNSAFDHWLFCHPFILPLVLRYLSDSDTLTGVLTCTKATKPALKGYLYVVKQPMNLRKAIRMQNKQFQHLPLGFGSLKNVDHLRLEAFPFLESLHFKDAYDKQIDADLLPSSLTHFT